MAKKKVKKAIKIIVIVIAVLIAINLFVNFFSRSDFGSRVIFKADYRQLQRVADYLCSLEQHNDSIFITPPFATMTVAPGEYEKTSDFKIRATMFMLFLKGYDEIGKNDTTVYFQRWYDGFEQFRGYALSLDKSGEIAVDFVVDQKQMPRENWYLYYDDYNEWRNLQN